MGWFFNKDDNNRNDSSQQGRNRGQQSFFQTRSSFYSKKRHCENDPEDNQFIICKTVIKDNNGTREEEERIPKSTYSNAPSKESNSFLYSSNFNNLFGNGRQDDQRAFDKFNSFFIKPSFFDMHNSSFSHNPQNQEIQSYSKSFSQSKSCHTDPEDPQYLICKSKVYDGKETKQVEQRIRATDQFMIPSFRRSFDNFGNQIDHEIHNLMRDINKGFNFMMPFIGPFMGFLDEIEKIDQQGLPSKGYPKNYERNVGKYDQDEFNRDNFNHTNRNKKDTNVYDL